MALDQPIDIETATKQDLELATKITITCPRCNNIPCDIENPKLLTYVCPNCETHYYADLKGD